MASHSMGLSDFGIELDTSTHDAWRPTPHGCFLAGVLHENPQIYRGKRVLELGAGLAVHTIILARGGASSVLATEITEELLEATKVNVDLNCKDSNVSYVVADWLNVDGTFDMVVTNPPFCMSGKRNRRYFIDDLILNTSKRLGSGGELMFVQSSMADIDKTLHRLRENGYEPNILEFDHGPFRDYYYETPGFMEEAAAVPTGFRVVDGKEWETLFVIHAKLT